MICCVRDVFAGLVDEIVVSVRDEPQHERVRDTLGNGFTYAYDEIDGIGPLSGIRSGLMRARGEYVAVAACDMPFISIAAYRILFEAAEGHDAAVPIRENGFLEPLHAVYRRESMLAAVEESLKEGERRLSGPLSRMKDVVYVPVEKFQKIDPGLKTFLNVNTAEDLPK
jgi:molybdopterin-guanine dinucleotide biosynthesis protein A